MATKFGQAVYDLLLKIPKGKVTTYKEIAHKLNCKAYRAVGNALHNNKEPDKYPCFKVINSDGRLGGFAFGRKEKIRRLKKEGIAVRNNRISQEQIFRF